jgi:hypothetical protein
VAFSHLTANPRGDALVVWNEGYGKYGTQVRVALRRAGGSFGKPVTLGTNTDECCAEVADVRAAINAQGRFVVAYAGDLDHVARPGRQVFAWTGTIAGGVDRTPHPAGRSAGNVELTAAIDGKGRAYVGWGTQSAGEEIDGPHIMRVASIGPGASRFGAQRTVDPGHGKEERDSSPPGLVADPTGGAWVDWIGSAPGEHAFAMRITAAGTYRKPQPLPGAYGLAVRRDGLAVVTYDSPGPDETTMAAYSRPGGGPFGKPESTGMLAGGIAFDPKTGGLHLIDIDDPEGGTASLVQAVRRKP